MASMPRIARAIPKGPVTTPADPIPVIACVHWLAGAGTLVDEDVYALAIAWTQDAVEIRWAGNDNHTDRTDWLPAAHIRRPGQERQPDDFPRKDDAEYVPLSQSERPAPSHHKSGTSV